MFARKCIFAWEHLQNLSSHQVLLPSPIALVWLRHELQSQRMQHILELGWISSNVHTATNTSIVFIALFTLSVVKRPLAILPGQAAISIVFPLFPISPCTSACTVFIGQNQRSLSVLYQHQNKALPFKNVYIMQVNTCCSSWAYSWCRIGPLSINPV